MRLPRRKHRRCGVFLVELVGLMVAGAVIMGVTVAALVAVLRADRQFARRLESRHSIDQLAKQLRRDVHAAGAAAWDADVRELRLETPVVGIVTYHETAGRWERRLRGAEGDDDVLAGAFRMPRTGKCLVDVEQTPEGTLVKVTWAPTAKPHDPTRVAPMPNEVVAVVGRDLELLYP